MSSKSLKFVTKLQGSRVLVIGGTSGIGFSVAEAALEFGATVIVSGSSQSRLDNAISRLRATISHGSPFIPSPDPNIVSGKTCDLSDTANLETNIEALLNFATNSGNNKLDHVVSTAGNTLDLMPLSDATIDSIQAAGLVRFPAVALIARFLPQYMKNDVSSSYTLTGGTNSWKPNPNWSVFAGIGAAVEGLARGLSVDIKPIRVNCVQPGAIKTELWGDSFGKEGKLEAALEIYRKQSVTNSVGTPEECAEAYIYCMRGSFTTGTTITCDGGRLII